MNLNELDDATQVEVLDFVRDRLGLVCVLEKALLEKDGDTRRLDIFGNVDELLHARHTLSALLCTHTGKVESVEGHLRHRLTKRLRGNAAHGLARITDGALELCLNFANDPVKCLLVEAVVRKHALRGKGRSHDDGKEVCGVLARLDRDRIVTREESISQIFQQFCRAVKNIVGL